MANILTKRGGKKAEGVFGMTFSMMFSILLIVFFVVAAFIAIRFFLSFQRTAEIGLFYEELQADVDEAWRANSAEINFNSTLPSGIEYACFMNLSADALAADAKEKEIYDYLKFSGASWKVNFALWPQDRVGELGYKEIKNVNLPDSNPYCIAVKGRAVNIRIEKKFGEALPRVS